MTQPTRRVQSRRVVKVLCCFTWLCEFARAISSGETTDWSKMRTEILEALECMGRRQWESDDKRDGRRSRRARAREAAGSLTRPHGLLRVSSTRLHAVNPVARRTAPSASAQSSRREIVERGDGTGNGGRGGRHKPQTATRRHPLEKKTKSFASRNVGVGEEQRQNTEPYSSQNRAMHEEHVIARNPPLCRELLGSRGPVNTVAFVPGTRPIHALRFGLGFAPSRAVPNSRATRKRPAQSVRPC